MAEVNTVEVEAKVDAAFGAAFSGTPPAPVEKVVEEVTADPAAPAVIAPPPAIVPEKPQYVRLTKQEWDNTKAAAGKVSSLESQLAKLTGSMPRAEQIAQQVLENVRSQTPAGTQIDPQVLIDAFADQDKDFPELAAQNRKAFEHVLKHLRGSTPAQSPAQPVDMKAAFEEWQSAREAAKEANALAEAYPDWSEIVGRPPAEGEPVNEGTPFRKWFATQPAAYQEKVGTTNSPAVVQAAIDKFKAGQTASPSSRPDRAAARRAVIEDAVTPRAEGNPPPLNPPQSADDAFASGFKAVKSH